MKAYFGEPRSPWPRGGKENASGLLHQRFPRGTDLSVYTQEQLLVTLFLSLVPSFY